MQETKNLERLAAEAADLDPAPPPPALPPDGIARPLTDESLVLPSAEFNRTLYLSGISSFEEPSSMATGFSTSKRINISKVRNAVTSVPLESKKRMYTYILTLNFGCSS